MELVVRRIGSWHRDAQGGTVVHEVDIGGAVRETCRLVLSTNAGIPAIERTLASTLSGKGGP